MRKSSLILLLAMAFVLATVAASFSSSIVDGPCKEICKHWGYGLRIDSTYSCTNPAQHAGTCPACPQFDYESARGYCTTTASPDSVSNYNAHGIIFHVCDCPDPNFDITKSYGIRIEIVEPATGVYFTNSNTSGADYTCATGCPNGTQNIYVSALGDTTDESQFCPMPCAAPATPFVMGYAPVNSGKVLFDPASMDKPIDPVTGVREECCLDCLGNLAKSIQTDCLQPIMFAGSPYIMIDVPTMVWDPKIISDGQEVVIKVTITGEKDASVCPTCNDLCDCTVKVGEFGCASTPTASECYTCFPYFTSIDEAGWWSGFALTNSGPEDADVVMTFWAGGSGVTLNFKVTANSVLVKSLSELDLSGLSGNGSIFATVVSTVPQADGGTKAAHMTGFAIMGDGAQAYGYLSKYGKCGCWP